MPDEFPADLTDLLPQYLAAQRWYSGSEAPPASEVHVLSSRELWSDGAEHQMWQLIVDAAGEHYQLILGVRPAGETADFLHGHESSVLGSAGGVFVYDAAWDADMAKLLLEVASNGAETASRARAVAVEQSNTSIVYDDRLILKVFRHLRPGRNPDVEVTSALAGAGFASVAAPLVDWRNDDYDLAFGQQFLAGGTEGWALALTSLRDLYSSTDYYASTDSFGGADHSSSDPSRSGRFRPPGDAGGDFAGEAERLGRVTAEMHVALHRVFGAAPPEQAAAGWHRLVDGLPARLAGAGKHLERDLLGAAGPLLERLTSVPDPGPAIRVHGDYHLGQVMRTDLGWYVLDFEGEPAKALEERTLPASVYKDVTGMLRSFHYASRHALVERVVADWADMVPSARAWEAHNRQAFLEGYHHHQEVGVLLPDASVSAVVMSAYELDKCLYELDYELSHRPEWVSIPLDALERLVEGGADG